MPDRTRPPQIHDIATLALPEPRCLRLSNGMPAYITSKGTQEVIKLEVAFHAGRPFERKPLVARAATSLLREGGARYSGADVAEMLDFYGGSLSLPFQMDTANVVLYSLNKHLGALLPVLEDVLSCPRYPEEELQAFIRRNQQRLAVDLSKNDTVAYRQITELFFGERHPYGYNSTAAAYGALQRQDLLAHHERLFRAGNAAVFISGKVADSALAAIDEALSRAVPPGEAAVPDVAAVETRPERVYLQQGEASQSALRIGRKLFGKGHEDYESFYVLNTVLGGYFGSRLMENIREEKGYTYNIYSMLDTMRYGGCFYVGTEVSQAYVPDTLEQIYLEMERLQEELIPEEELQMVRNYLLGNFLTMVDGPFNISEVVRTFVLEGQPLSKFGQLVQAVKAVQPESLRQLARKYFRKEDMWEVVVGA